MTALFKNIIGRNDASIPPVPESVKEDRSVMDIKEDVFIEKNPISSDGYSSKTKVILAIYHYLEWDIETKGFNDAMVSPDESYKRENVQLIKYDLEIIIQKVRIYHDSLLKDLDFHILSRSRAGLVDLVEELKSRKTDLMEHIQKVNEIDTSLKSNNGYCERAILSYQRGFTKGMASITQASLLTKSF